MKNSFFIDEKLVEFLSEEDDYISICFLANYEMVITFLDDEESVYLQPPYTFEQFKAKFKECYADNLQELNELDLIFLSHLGSYGVIINSGYRFA